MAKDAEVNAADDRRRAEEITERNLADQMVYSTEKMLKEHRDKVSEADAKAVDDALEETQQGDRRSGNLDEIRAGEGQADPGQPQAGGGDVHRQRGSAGSGRRRRQPELTAQSPGAEQPKDNVVDAEFVDVDDKK